MGYGHSALSQYIHPRVRAATENFALQKGLKLENNACGHGSGSMAAHSPQHLSRQLQLEVSNTFPTKPPLGGLVCPPHPVYAKHRIILNSYVLHSDYVSNALVLP